MQGISYIVSRHGVGDELGTGTWPDTLRLDETILESRRDDGQHEAAALEAYQTDSEVTR